MTTFLAILTGGGLAALGGLLSGLVTNWLGDKRDQRKYEHERAMAADARRQERLEQAYIELLAYLAHNAGWARSVRPMVAIKAPDPLTSEEIQRVEALVAAFGSEEVRQLLDEWFQRMHALAAANATVAEMEDWNKPSQQLDAETRKVLAAIPDYKDAVLEADTAIRKRVRQELAGEV
jgi:hypothetical protein